MADRPHSGGSDSSQQTQRGWFLLKQYVLENKVKVGMWVTRIFTILFTVGYLLPFFGNPYNSYYKVLMASSATSALRLHQRVPTVRFNVEFLQLLLLEDSCHYLLYSSIFLYVSPVALVLAPVFLFAVIHSASETLLLLDALGQNSCWQMRLLISFVEYKSRSILRLIALCEILILPLAIILVFSGRAGLLTPFIYFQFLKMRLASRRNPFTRNTFTELQNALTRISQQPSMPGVLRHLLNGLLTITQQMTPPNPIQ